MNINCKCHLIILALVTAALPLSAAKQKNKPKTYTLKNGRVLVAPQIVGRNPNGLEVSHAEGVSFIPFSQMQKKTQERFNYSPDKAKKFVKHQTALKKRDEQRRKAEAKAFAQRRAAYAKRLAAFNQEQLGDEIYKLKERIKFLQAEIPKLESQQDKYMATAVNMASESANNDTGYGGYFGGSLAGGGSSRAERTKRRAVRDVGDEYAEAKSDLKRYQSELEDNILLLRKLEREYKKNGGNLKDVGKVTPSKKEKKSFLAPVTNLFK